MADIYSSYFKQGIYFAPPKNSIRGIVLHNDASSWGAKAWESQLTAKVNNGTLATGFAAYYVDRNDVLVFQPVNYQEWHTATYEGNANYIGIEACQSMGSSDEDFIANEDAALMIAGELLESYGLPVNEDTVRLHHEFSANYGAGTQNCKAYFIDRIKKLRSGEVKIGEIPAAEVVEKSILDEDVELPKRDQAYYEATVSIDYYLESQPSLDSEDKEFVAAGTRVRVYEKKDGWSRVNYKDSDQWIEDKYLTECE